MASRLTGDARGRRLAGSNHIATRRFAWRVRAEHGPRRPYVESTIVSESPEPSPCGGLRSVTVRWTNQHQLVDAFLVVVGPRAVPSSPRHANIPLRSSPSRKREGVVGFF